MSVERTRQGTYRVRVFADGERRSLGVFETEAEALDVEEKAHTEIAKSAGTTLGVHGKEWLDRRERDGVRGIRTERGRWRTHVATHAIASKPLILITTKDIERWIEGLKHKVTSTPHRKAKPLSPKTIREVVLLLRQCFDDAKLDTNPVAIPAREFAKVQRRRGVTVEPWTYLEPREQLAIAGCRDIPEHHRLMILFALYTGLRQGEQFNLRLEDLKLDGPDHPHVVVRFGSAGLPPKNGRIRRVYLLQQAVDVARRWLEVLPKYLGDAKNERRLAFPGSAGGRVTRGKTPLQVSEKRGERHYGKLDLWPVYLLNAGIERPVRWHDLRHSCASSLVAGWWGRRWSLEEVREYLGHTSIVSTQRYAHLGETALKSAVLETWESGARSPARRDH